MASNIQFSHCLRCVTIHRMQCLSCPRKYFWRYVANLEPKSLSLPLWFGRMVHAGLGARLSGRTAAAAKLAMVMSDRETCKEHGASVPADTQREMEIYRAIGPAMVEGFHAFAGARVELRCTEQQFSVPLSCGVMFCGTRDAEGTYESKTALFEFKTASQISQDTFDTMAFNGQVYGYIASLSPAKRPARFVYAVLRKPSKWVKRGQSIAEFVQEIKDDIKARPEFYFAVWLQAPGVNAIGWALADIEAATNDLWHKYNRLSRVHGGLHQPMNWPRNDQQCHSYGRCPFLDLCKESWNWQLKARMLYATRAPQYNIEHEERKEIK